MPPRTEHETSRHARHDRTILVLQGGGALGAYQAGVYEALHDAGLAPEWVTGVSIGAINGALIAGNRLPDRIARLRQFWDRVSSGFTFAAPAPYDPWRLAFSQLSSTATAVFGVPGFFVPRAPLALVVPSSAPGAGSLYDASPLRDTLLELVDFDLINSRAGRLSVGTVNVQTGNSVYFDSNDSALVMGAEHIMASAALPPGFAPVRIAGGWYWDGGLASNTPLWYVLDDSPRLNALLLQVDLFSARGPTPHSLDQALERAKDIQYSSKTRFNTTRARDEEALRQALRSVIRRLPARLRNDASVKVLAERAHGRHVSLVHLVNRRSTWSSQAKDYDFSRSNVRTLWHAGH